MRLHYEAVLVAFCVASRTLLVHNAASLETAWWPALPAGMGPWCEGHVVSSPIVWSRLVQLRVLLSFLLACGLDSAFQCLLSSA